MAVDIDETMASDEQSAREHQTILQELWLKDCKNISEEVVGRACRMGVHVRVWQDGEEVKVKDAPRATHGRRRRTKVRLQRV